MERTFHAIQHYTRLSNTFFFSLRTVKCCDFAAPRVYSCELSELNNAKWWIDKRRPKLHNRYAATFGSGLDCCSCRRHLCRWWELNYKLWTDEIGKQNMYFPVPCPSDEGTKYLRIFCSVRSTYRGNVLIKIVHFVRVRTEVATVTNKYCFCVESDVGDSREKMDFVDRVKTFRFENALKESIKWVEHGSFVMNYSFFGRECVARTVWTHVPLHQLNKSHKSFWLLHLVVETMGDMLCPVSREIIKRTRVHWNSSRMQKFKSLNDWQWNASGVRLRIGIFSSILFRDLIPWHTCVGCGCDVCVCVDWGTRRNVRNPFAVDLSFSFMSRFIFYGW